MLPTSTTNADPKLSSAPDVVAANEVKFVRRKLSTLEFNKDTTSKETEFCVFPARDIVEDSCTIILELFRSRKLPDDCMATQLEPLLVKVNDESINDEPSASETLTSEIRGDLKFTSPKKDERSAESEDERLKFPLTIKLLFVKELPETTKLTGARRSVASDKLETSDMLEETIVVVFTVIDKFATVDGRPASSDMRSKMTTLLRRYD